jgi:hypothetical protein
MRSKKWMSVKKSKYFREIVAGGAVTLVVCAIAAAMLFASRSPSQPSDVSERTARSKRGTVAQSSSDARKGTAKQPQAKKTSTSSASAAKRTSNPATEPGAVRITGCLERDGSTYSLKDAAGTDVPQSRSWKSGFLRKDTPSIEIVDAQNRLKLANYVGRRVSVTGLLVDREMIGRSLQWVAGSCE